jgi:hypothetical protein
VWAPWHWKYRTTAAALDADCRVAIRSNLAIPSTARPVRQRSERRLNGALAILLFVEDGATISLPAAAT